MLCLFFHLTGEQHEHISEQEAIERFAQTVVQHKTNDSSAGMCDTFCAQFGRLAS